MSKTRLMLSALALSAAGFLGIVSYEGYAPVPYQDSGGVWTDGFGNTKSVDPAKHVSVEQALHQAGRNVTVAEGAVKRCVKVPLTQGEYDADTSLAYNIGETAFCRSTLVKKQNAGDYAGACAEFDRWNRVNGKVSRGLTRRRAAERARCEGRV